MEFQGGLALEMLVDADQAGIQRVLGQGVIQAAGLGAGVLDLGAEVRAQVGEALGGDADRAGKDEGNERVSLKAVGRIPRPSTGSG